MNAVKGEEMASVIDGNRPDAPEADSDPVPQATGPVVMDRRDLELLSDIVGLYDVLDPAPKELAEAILFALGTRPSGLRR